MADDFFIPVFYTGDDEIISGSTLPSGHAGWIQIDGDTNEAKFYDFGPYGEPGTAGNLRQLFPDGTTVNINSGNPDLSQLAELVRQATVGTWGFDADFGMVPFNMGSNGYQTLDGHYDGHWDDLGYYVALFQDCYGEVMKAAASVGINLDAFDGSGTFTPPGALRQLLKEFGGVYYDKDTNTLHTITPDTLTKIHSFFDAIVPGLGFYQDILNLFGDAKAVICPLVLDLDGDGIELTNIGNNEGVYFDLNIDGFSEATAWTTGGDGLLVLDINQDQVIQGSEVFGNQTGFENGFLALGRYDSNGDGQITADDEVYGRLQVWVDDNPNGVAEDGELFSLPDLNITSINLNYSQVGYLIEGNQINQESSFVIDGTSRNISDAYLVTDPSRSVYAQDFNVDLDAIDLPTAKGYGILPDLFISICLDNNKSDPNSLFSLVQSFYETSLEDLFSSTTAALESVREILFRWAGVDGVVSGSRGAWVDAQEVTFLEKFLGDVFHQGTHGPIPTGRAGPLVDAAFDEAFNHVYAVLALQGAGAELFTGEIFYNIFSDSFEGITGLDLVTLSTLASEANGLSTTEEKEVFWQNVVRVIEYGYGLDNLTGGETASLESAITTSDVTLNLADILDSLVTDYLGAHFIGTAGGDSSISNTSGDDWIEGKGGNDTVDGQAGNDQIETLTGNDTLTGGTGDDLLISGAGNDVFIYNPGDGNDVIYDDAGTDKIVFGPGISRADITLSREGWDLVIDIDTGTETGQIIVNNHFYSATYSVETIEYADNSVTSLTNLNHVVANGTIYNDVISGLSAVGGPDDEIHGGDGNDVINGLGGTDTLYGDAGNDTHDGGTGADTMAGGTGNDTYYVDNAGDVVTENSGEGTDTVISSLTYTLTGSNVENLILSGTSSIHGTGNSVKNVITGNSAVNTLTGGAGDDTLNGGGGNDRLVGGTDNDTYVVNNSGITIVENASEGTDTVKSSLASYTLGTNLENLTLTGAGDINGTGNSAVNVLTGNIGDNTLDGSTGADTMIGGKGDDTYVVDDAGDVVTELADAGNDTVQSSVSFTLGATLENLTLTGASVLTATGNSGDNTLTGNTAASSLIGGDGDDTYVITNASTVITENTGEGTDTLSASGAAATTFTLAANVENLVLTGATAIKGVGNSLDNTLYGNSGSNTLDGGSANDTLWGGTAGTDTLIGGSGNDTFIVDRTSGINFVEASSGGTDTVLASVNHTLSATQEIENLVLTGAGDINGTGNTLVNTITGNSGNNTLDGGTDADTLIGGLGNDTYVVDNAGDVVTELADQGADTVQTALNNYTLTSNVENLTLTGASVLTGTGNSLDNTLTGNTAASSLVGGAGNDTYVITNASTVIVENTSEGTDTVSASGTAATVFTLSNTQEIENLTLTGTTAIKGVGNDLGNVMNGNSGSNTLDGGIGNDTLWGGTAGTDTLIGGAGDDTFIVDRSSGITISEGASAGTDTVQASVTYTLGTNLENLTLTSTSAINGTGNTVVNVITGNSAINTLDGGTGADTLIGGDGDDIYIVDNTGDVVTENSNQGIDTVQSSASSYTLSANVENLTLTGASVISGTGNSLDNTLTGNTAASSLAGAAGNDTYVITNASTVITENTGEGTDTVSASGTAGTTFTLSSSQEIENLTLTGTTGIHGTGNSLDNTIIGNSGANTLTGGGGHDYLDGGTGADRMVGGDGNDTYVVNVTTDVLVENPGEGTDTVIAGATWTLATDFENLTLSGSSSINATGNSAVNTLTGNSGANSLNGMAGADTLIGGAGNDTYFVDDAGDVVIENSGEGTDIVQSSISYALTSNVENLTLTGTANIDATGNALAGNTLTGNSGNNTLDGGAGVDRMVGGAGDDTYIVDDENDVVVESLTSGTDTVRSSVSYTLAGNVENLVLTGTANIDGTGNTLVNTITGNTGNNTLDGGTGADILTGGAGNDTYIVDNAGDALTENSGEGTDTVRSSVTWTLAATFEHLTLTGAGVIDGTGNNGDNIITGNSAKNVLTGSGGNDTLEGGGGADTMGGGTGDDVYIASTTTTVINENSGEGTDTVQSIITWTLGTNLENLVLTGTSAINGTGNSGVNTITGNSGINTLDGGTGADTMIGGGGNDLYLVDDAGDVVTEGLSSGTDTVQTGLSYTLSDNVENLILTGASVLTGTGNALANTITGNSAASSLVGGAGNDTYIITNASTSIIENSNEGTDTVSASSTTAGTTFTLSNNVENLTLTGTNAINGTGNSLSNTITGTTGNNTLTGGVGNDVLNGNGGVDTLVGETGDDYYYVDSTTDVVTELSGEGTDTVSSSVNWTLGTYVENLYLTGSALIGTGNSGDNTMIGHSGTNTLNGGDGNDYLSDGGGGGSSEKLIGGAGDDTYFISDAAGTITEAVGAGTDTVLLSQVFASASYTLANNVEILVLPYLSLFGGAVTGNALDNTIIGNEYGTTISGGGGNDNLFGMEGNDRLIGGTGNDTLDGGTGADTMEGSGGNDVFFVDNTGDIVTAGAGTDTVNSSVSWTMAANVENLTLTGIGNINGTGNTLANTIIGNSGDNTLSGSDGNDTLMGGDGLDTLIGGNNADTFLFESATAFNDRDIIQDFNTGQSDKIDLSDVLDGHFNPGTDNINNFVKFDNALNGTDTIMSVDLDGTGGTYGWQQVAILSNLTGVADAATLVASTNLIVS